MNFFLVMNLATPHSSSRPLFSSYTHSLCRLCTSLLFTWLGVSKSIVKLVQKWSATSEIILHFLRPLLRQVPRYDGYRLHGRSPLQLGPPWRWTPHIFFVRMCSCFDIEFAKVSALFLFRFRAWIRLGLNLNLFISELNLGKPKNDFLLHHF